MKNSFPKTYNQNFIASLSESELKKEEYLTSEQMFQKLPAKSKKLITDFLSYKDNCNISLSRRGNIRNHLIKFAYCIETPLDKATKNQIDSVGGLLNKSNLKPSSIGDQIVDVRQFYKWINGNREFPEKVWDFIIRKKAHREERLQKEDLLSEEEIYQMIHACNNSRDKFFIALVGLDGGLRPIEARNLTWKDLKKDDNSYYLIVHTAKGSGDSPTRAIRIIKSAPQLTRWMADYPKEKKDEFYIFCDLKNANLNINKPFNENTVGSLFKRLKVKLGWKKNIFPYLMRHSILTKLAGDPRISQAVLKAIAGHKKNSNVISVYTHLASSDVLDAQLVMNGIKSQTETKKEEKMPVNCPRCKTPNEPDAEICITCNMALTQKRMVASFEKNKEFEQMQDKVNELWTLLSKDKRYHLSEDKDPKNLMQIERMIEENDDAYEKPVWGVKEIREVKKI